MHDAEQCDEDRADDLDAMAAVWLARLREPSVSPNERAAFERWLAVDPSHGMAYARAERLWRHLELPAAIAQRRAAEHRPSVPRTRRWLGAGLAAALVAVGVAGTWGMGWGEMALARLRADYATTVGTRTDVTLADGSRLVLDSDSAVEVHISAKQRRVSLLRGRARFEVRRDAGRPFRVDTPTGTVTVTGTVFDVLLSERSALVSLEEGRIEMRTVSDPSGAPTVLVPGQAAWLGPTDISTPQHFDRTAQDAWLRDQIVFSSAPLSDVIAALDRYYPGRIVIADDALASMTLSGAFSTRTPIRALKAIGDIVPVKVTAVSDFLIVLH